MKRTFVLLLLCVALAAAQSGPAAAPARTVYLLPMGHGLDQFLANHLASRGAFQVVTDPKQADAILTDRIGPAFEARMNDLFPPPAPAPAAVPDDAKDAKDAKEDEGSELVQALAGVPPAAPGSSFARGKGNVFLVDAQSRLVLWSAFEQPAGGAAEDLNRAASRIVARLRKDMSVSRAKGEKRAPAPAPPAK